MHIGHNFLFNNYLVSSVFLKYEKMSESFGLEDSTFKQIDWENLKYNDQL